MLPKYAAANEIPHEFGHEFFMERVKINYLTVMAIPWQDINVNFVSFSMINF